MNRIYLLVFYYLISVSQIVGKGSGFYLSFHELEKNISVYFTAGWKYNQGDVPGYQTREFNDSNWAEVSTLFNDNLLNNWNGKGWFRFHFTIDTSLYNKSVFLLIRSAGKQEIFLDGKYAADVSDLENLKTITFSPMPNHIIAIKYLNNNTRYYKNAGFNPGFEFGFGSIEKVLQSDIKKLRGYSNQQMFFTALTIAFGILHFILFLFNRQFKENLIYAIFLFIYSASIFFDYQTNLSVSTTELILSLRVHRVLMSLSMVFILLSLYSILKQKIQITFLLITFYFLFALTMAILKPVQNFIFIQAGLIIVFIECSRIIIKASKQNVESVTIIGTGFSILFLFSLYDWLLDFHLINSIWNLDNGYPFGTIGLFICMSIFLSKSFARSNLKIIQQEKLNKEQEVERKYLEAENKRKTLDLEDARKLQLSILPKSFPELSQIEVSGKMRTAAEVGGDYYDYHLSSDGTFTVVIGDATGHGIKAGIMVALIKSLFDAMAHTFFIPDFFNHCTKTIKKMNLGNLYMGLTVIKFRDYKITASAAGMPPFLIFRKSSNSIEEIILKGMPLGAFHDFPYQQKSLKVYPGDTILLLTDGFVELFNSTREMIDYNLVKNKFLNSAEKSSEAIIDDLINLADNWLNGYQQMDDITFLVIKIK